MSGPRRVCAECGKSVRERVDGRLFKHRLPGSGIWCPNTSPVNSRRAAVNS